MQIVWCVCILILSTAVFYLLGRALCIRCGWNLRPAEIFCVGFFLYFALFQVPAEIMILTKQKLHVLGNVWSVILVLLSGAALSVIYKGRRKQKASFRRKPLGRKKWTGAAKLAAGIMAAAIVCECASALLLQRSIGWDFAYYIGNMTTSAATDTMYLYDGSSGLLRSQIDLRYALSSFYMHTAWISQMTGISALLLQKYVMGILCVLLTNAVVYSFAMEVFFEDRKRASVLVIITILLTVFWDVYDTSAQFLMLRSYEAKAYCANIVLPMVFYLLYRIWKNSENLCSWGELFLVSTASVPVSMSSIMLVPVLTGIMLLAHLAVDRQRAAVLIRRTALCLMPNVFYLLVYFSYTRGWLVIQV